MLAKVRNCNKDHSILYGPVSPFLCPLSTLNIYGVVVWSGSGYTCLLGQIPH